MNAGESPSRSAGAPEDRSPAWASLWPLLVFVAAIVPSVGTWSTPLISDDGAALGYVHREGPWADWAQPQYDLRSVRFWRPLVTASLGLQERMTGVDPVPLRLFNLLGHALTAVLAGALARRLGGGAVGALVAGLLVAGYPEQGGNVVWIVGRVDSQCVPLVLLACVLALDDRRLLALVAAFLALATKELAVVTPVWVLLLAWARGDGVRPALRRAAPFFGLLALVILGRRYALGTWVGGYPDESRGLGLELVPQVARNLAAMLGLPLAVAVATSWLPGAAEGRGGRARRCAALAAAGLVAALPMVHLLAAPSVLEEHRRTFWLADAALCVAVGASARWRVRGALEAAVVLGLAGFALWRGALAWEDSRSWRDGGRQAERELAAAREFAVEASGESSLPVFDTGFSRTTAEGAYVLHWGVADRFRAPFPSSARPVWPWRPLIHGPGSERSPRWPPGSAFVPVFAENELHPLGYPPFFELETDEGVPLESPQRLGLELLGADGAVDPSPRVRFLRGGVEGWEVVLVTELGYRAAPISTFDERGVTFTLREALLATSDALLLALEFQTERAFLEVRGYGPGGVDDVRYVSEWLTLTWDLETLRPAVLPLE